MKHETDILIQELRRQNPAACQRLIADYGPAVYQTVQRIVAVQDVFVKAIQAIGSYDRRQATLGTWLKHIAYHESLNFVRSHRPANVILVTNEAGDCLVSDTNEQTIIEI